jgi:hypothetical protein
MKRIVVIIKHENDHDIFLTDQRIRVYGGIRGEASRLWLVEDIHYIPKSIAINLPDDIIQSFFLCVGVENKSDEHINYSSAQVNFEIDNINNRFKEIILNGILK